MAKATIYNAGGHLHQVTAVGSSFKLLHSEKLRPLEHVFSSTNSKRNFGEYSNSTSILLLEDRSLPTLRHQCMKIGFQKIAASLNPSFAGCLQTQ